MTDKEQSKIEVPYDLLHAKQSKRVYFLVPFSGRAIDPELHKKRRELVFEAQGKICIIRNISDEQLNLINENNCFVNIKDDVNRTLLETKVTVFE